MVSIPQYTEHILPITKELVTYCEKELDIMILMHNSETKVDHVLSHLPLGVSIESVGPDADIRQIIYPESIVNVKWVSRYPELP
jgi:hypothetical protein